MNVIKLVQVKRQIMRRASSGKGIKSMNPIRSMQEVMKRSALGLGAAAVMGVVAAGLFPGACLAAGPAGVTDAALWLDASQLTGLNNGDTVSTWTDMSGNGNHAAAAGSAATYQTGALNGQPVVRFNADGNASFNFTEDAAIRTVFWVVKNTHPGEHFMLGDSNRVYDFHAGYSTLWSDQWVSDSIKNGTTKLMGTSVNGTTTVLPSDSYSLVTLVTTGPVRANTLSVDRGMGGRSWTGDMAEVLIYNRALSWTEELAVGNYLAVKYGLATAYQTAGGPAGVTGAALWLDAAQLAGLTNDATVATWNDMSGNNRHAIATGTAATYQTNALNGQPVVRFSADGNASFNFTEDPAIRTVFWVVKKTNPGFNFLLGDSGAYDFHTEWNALWSADYASASVKNGTTKLMGTPVNGRTTALPSAAYSLVTLVTTGNVRANQLTLDRGYGGRSWTGDMAEILIYDRALSSAEELAVGKYLAAKYGLVTQYLPGNTAALWLDASQLTGLTDGDTVATWTDMSGNGNHAAATGNAATYQIGALNGQPVVRFNADGNSSFNFTEDTAIRTVFWVVKNTNHGLHFLLGDSNGAYYDFHGGDAAEIWHTTWTSASIRNGTTKLMGTPVNGLTTVLPSASYSLVSLVTTGPVRANTLTADRGMVGRSWAGDMAEVLIYDHALSAAEERAVGTYLATKYALATEYTSAGITWGSAQTMSADTDVITTGMLNYAYGFSAAATVNTVPFALGSSVSSLGTDVTLSRSFSARYTDYGNGTAAPFTSLSAEYQAMTTGGLYGDSGDYNIALNNLTPGHTYLVQIWVNESRNSFGRNETVTSTGPGGNTVTLVYNTTSAVGGVGQSVAGTFTAVGTSQTFTLKGNDSTQLNALQLRTMPIYWDNNGSTAGFGAASGTWAAPATGNSNQGWSADATGNTPPADFTSILTDAVHFGNGATGLGAGTVTVSGAVSAGDITFASGSGAITLAGGTITLPDSATLVVNNVSDAISSVLAGAGNSLTKSGPGTLILSGANTYTGSTTVNAGTLLANNTSGSGTGAGNVTVNDGATFGGTGTISGNVTFQTGGKALFSDAGTLTFTGSLTLNDTVVHLPVALPYGSFTLATYTTLSGTFASVPVFDSGSIVGLSKIITGGGQVVLKVFPPGTMICIF